MAWLSGEKYAPSARVEGKKCHYGGEKIPLWVSTRYDTFSCDWCSDHSTVRRGPLRRYKCKLTPFYYTDLGTRTDTSPAMIFLSRHLFTSLEAVASFRAIDMNNVYCQPKFLRFPRHNFLSHYKNSCDCEKYAGVKSGGNGYRIATCAGKSVVLLSV